MSKAAPRHEPNTPLTAAQVGDGIHEWLNVRYEHGEPRVQLMGAQAYGERTATAAYEVPADAVDASGLKEILQGLLEDHQQALRGQVMRAVARALLAADAHGEV